MKIGVKNTLMASGAGLHAPSNAVAVLFVFFVDKSRFLA